MSTSTVSISTWPRLRGTSQSTATNYPQIMFSIFQEVKLPIIVLASFIGSAFYVGYLVGISSVRPEVCRLYQEVRQAIESRSVHAEAAEKLNRRLR